VVENAPPVFQARLVGQSTVMVMRTEKWMRSWLGQLPESTIVDMHHVSRPVGSRTATVIRHGDTYALILGTKGEPKPHAVEELGAERAARALWAWMLPARPAGSSTVPVVRRRDSAG